jgi:hypothetical protein
MVNRTAIVIKLFLLTKVVEQLALDRAGFLGVEARVKSRQDIQLIFGAKFCQKRTSLNWTAHYK